MAKLSRRFLSISMAAMPSASIGAFVGSDPQPAASREPGIAPSPRPKSDTLTFEAFGARGDGVTDDTPAIQSALEAGKQIGAWVRGSPGRRYAVGKRVQQSGKWTALVLRSGMYLDTNGGVICLLPSQGDCSILQSEDVERSRGTPNVRRAAVHGRFDGNGAAQGTPPSAFTPLLYLNRISEVSVNVEVTAARHAAVYCTGSDDEVFDNKLSAKIDGVHGTGVHLDGRNWTIDRVRTHDTRYLDENAEGNGFIASLRDSDVGVVHCSDFAFGVKLQDGCARSQVGRIHAVGGPNGRVANGGDGRNVKIQGGARRNQTLTIGEILSDDAAANGLYITNSDRVSIGVYVSTDSTTEAGARPSAIDQADIAILRSSGLSIETVNISEQHGVGIYLEDCGGQTLTIGSLRVTSSRPSASYPVWRAGGGQVAIGRMRVTGRNWRAPLLNVTIRNGKAAPGELIVTDLSGDLDVEDLVKHGTVWASAETADEKLRINALRFAGYPDVFEVELARSATATALAAAHVHHRADPTSSGQFLEVTPLNAAALELASRGPIVASPIRLSAGGGIRLLHPRTDGRGGCRVLVRLGAYHAPYMGPRG